MVYTMVYTIVATRLELPYGSAFMKINGASSRKKGTSQRKLLDKKSQKHFLNPAPPH
jgi:hypothetical protein